MKFRGQWLLTAMILKSWPLSSVCSCGGSFVFSVSSAEAWLVFSAPADPITITAPASPQENLPCKAESFFCGLFQAKFGTWSSRLNFPRLSLVPPRARLNPLAELVVPRAGLRWAGALRWASWFARREGLRAFPRVRPPQLRLHSLPRPARLSSGMAAGGESRCYPAASPPLHLRAPPARGDARCRPRALSVRRPAPPRLAPPRPLRGPTSSAREAGARRAARG